MERIKQLSSHLSGAKGLAALERKNPDDVVITMAIRSPLCKAKKGGFNDTTYALRVIIAEPGACAEVIFTGPTN